ncbi:MAG TPA: deoxyribose-phosphate aldolase [Puia sp.]|nr:deoxyribose-phosphate aldolase [Puia sp.]
MINIASYIDHTILKPVTTYIEIKKICEEAKTCGFAAVCVPPPLVILAGEWLDGGKEGTAKGPHQVVRQPSSGDLRHGVKVATVIGFPFGYSVEKAKLSETEQALADGADELDVVINLVALKNGDWGALSREISAVTKRVHDRGKIVKVIIESGILKDEEIIRCCEIMGGLGVDFLKTSTGYAERGATLEAVQLMRQHLPSGVRIKASGGIRTYAFARDLVAAGADRLGCSASVAIVKEEKEASQKN